MSGPMQSEGDAHHRGQEELSVDVEAGDMPVWWG